MQTKEKDSRGRDSGVQKCEPVRFPFKNQETVSELGFCAPKTSKLVSSAWLKIQISDTVVGFMLVFAIAVAIQKECRILSGHARTGTCLLCWFLRNFHRLHVGLFCSNKKNKQDPSSFSILQ